jgi:DNA-binding Lrp family transcriptional regulator
MSRSKLADAVDVRIVDALQRDAKLSAQELAERVGASTTVCWRRVRRLQSAGVLRRAAMLVDPARVGVPEVVFARIRMASHQPDVTRAFEASMQAREEVLECYPLMGNADYQLKVAVPGIAAYNQFLQDFLLRLDGVANVESSFALREVKNDPALPVARFAAQID